MSLKNKTIVVTGITGFAGSHMAKHLLAEGAKVIGLVRPRADGCISQNIKCLGIEKDIVLADCDIVDFASVSSFLANYKPDIIFHFAAQSFVASSFLEPSVTMEVNCTGTLNILEAIRTRGLTPVIVFAGSSEEYGLVLFSDAQYKQMKESYGSIFPQPTQIPELPIKETNPLRPISPYAVSKVYGDYLMRNYHFSYGVKTIVSRAFNHEGAGRGRMFVTASLTRQVVHFKRGDTDKIVVGNVNAFRDWSHVNDIIRGYCLLAEKGSYGEVYNQGSQRTNSVLTYLLLSVENAGYKVHKIESLDGKKSVENPNEMDNSRIFGLSFPKTRLDKLILEGKLEFTLADGGITIITDKGKINVEFDEKRFRPSDVPILLSSTEKIEKLGFKTQLNLSDIINDQLNYWSSYPAL